MVPPLGEKVSRDHKQFFVVIPTSQKKIKWVGKDVRIDAHQGSFGGKTGFSY